MSDFPLTFADCAELVSRQIHPKDVPQDTPYIGLEHIVENGLFLNGAGLASDVDSQKSVFKKGDILFGKLRPYFRKVVIAPCDGICSTDIWVVRPKENTDRNFLFYWMASHKFIDDTTRASEGTKMPRAKWDVVAKFKKPECENEKEVGFKLRSIDEKIAINHQINQILESMAQAIFKSWFVDFEPVKAKITAIVGGEDAEGVTCAAMRAISGKTDDELDQLQAEQPENYAQLKSSAEVFPSAMQSLGEVPEGWCLKPLYETAEYVNGAAFTDKDFSETSSSLPIIKIAELKQGISSGTRYTKKEVEEKYFIDNHDVLYSWSGSPETSLDIFKWFGGKGYLNQHIFKLNFENSHQKYFTYYLLKHMKPLLIRTAQQKQTTGLGHITVADMKRMLVVYPDDQTLMRFSDVVCPIYEQNSILQIEISNLVTLRDTLLPKLLSGELEVNVAGLEEEN